MGDVSQTMRPRRAPRVLLAIATSILLPASVAGQTLSSTVDLARLTMRLDSSSAVATSITPVMRLEGNRGTLGLGGTISHFEGASWTAQGSVNGSIFARARGLLAGELGGTAGGSLQNGATGTAQTLAHGRMHLMGPGYGAWAGVGGGGGWDGARWHDLRFAEGAAWFHVGPATALAVVTPTVMDDSVRYTDAELALRIHVRSVEIGASGGRRNRAQFGDGSDERRTWGRVSAAVWFARWGAVVASAGTYPVDLMQGYPGGRFALIGVRLGRDTRHATFEERQRELGVVRHAAVARRQGLQSFSIERQANGQQRLTAEAAGARKVEVLGDFTGWNPVSLVRGSDGLWRVTLPIPSGVHEMVARLDGGEWLVPPGLAAVADEFGGVVGLLFVR